MSEGPRQPPFLARQAYRRRRLMDAARLLPLLGVFLFLLPVLWGPQPGAGAGRVTVGDGIYLLLAWAGLIVAAFLLARVLAPEVGAPAPPAPPPPPGQGAVPTHRTPDQRAPDQRAPDQRAPDRPSPDGPGEAPG